MSPAKKTKKILKKKKPVAKNSTKKVTAPTLKKSAKQTKKAAAKRSTGGNASTQKKQQSRGNRDFHSIGVIHLPPLPGAPVGKSFAELVQEAGMLAIEQAQLLEKEGFNALILENFGDTPFFKDRVPEETLASFSVIAAAVRQAVSIPVGINVLRNDAMAAMAIAAVNQCQFIRVNVLSGVAATDQGVIEGNAAEWIRRKAVQAPEIQIWADVHVKHAKSLSSDDLGLAIEETALRAGADAIIITGKTTGRPVDFEALEEAYKHTQACSVPLFIGSGAQPDQISALKAFSDGAIVGSFIRKNGVAGAPLDLARIRAWIKAVRGK